MSNEETTTNECTDSQLPQNRMKGACPICGEPADDVTELSERHRDGETQSIPGRAYDHSATSSGACFEWADGETSSSKL